MLPTNQPTDRPTVQLSRQPTKPPTNLWGAGCSLVCSAHPAQAALLLYAPRLALLRWLVGCSVVRLGGWLGLCVIAHGSSWLKPRRLKCRRTCNLGCWVLVVAWWFWGVLAGLGAAWPRLPGLLAGSVLGASLGCAGVGRSAGACLVLLVRGRSVAVWLAAVAAGTGVVLGGVAWFGFACGCFGAGRLVVLGGGGRLVLLPVWGVRVPWECLDSLGTSAELQAGPLQWGLAGVEAGPHASRRTRRSPRVRDWVRGRSWREGGR